MVAVLDHFGAYTELFGIGPFLKDELKILFEGVEKGRIIELIFIDGKVANLV